MNLAVSNFSWENIQHQFVFDELKKYGINQIESVLTKIDNWNNLNDDVIKKYKDELLSHEMKAYSIQSLFYNVNCKNFCDKDIMLSHFHRLITYSNILGVKVLVLGSPTLRIFQDGWKNELVYVFIKIDEMLDSTNIKLVIEPNSTTYGAQYFNTLGEIVLFLDLYEFRNIKTMIDTHNSFLEESDPIIELSQFYDYIEHIHVSEIKLEPLKDMDFHNNFAQTLKKYDYNKTVTFELGNYPNFSNSIETFTNIYK